MFHIYFLSSCNSFGYMVSEEMIFRNRPIRNKNYLWRPCLLPDRGKMSNLYKELSIYFLPNSVHLAKWFQRRRLNCEKLTDDRRRTPSDGKSLHCLKQLKQTCSVHVYANMANIDKSKLKINPLFPH